MFIRLKLYCKLNLSLASTNTLSSAGKTYRSIIIDADSELNNSHSIIRWNHSCK